MASTGLEVFDRTLQTTNAWLDDIMEELGPDRHLAWHALGSVLHAVRDRLPLELAVHLGAQLPLLVRGLYYDQWHVGGQPAGWHTLDDFLNVVADGLHGSRPVNVRDVAGSTLLVLAEHIDVGQLDKIISALPRELRAFWHAQLEGDSAP